MMQKGDSRKQENFCKKNEATKFDTRTAYVIGLTVSGLEF